MLPHRYLCLKHSLPFLGHPCLSQSSPSLLGRLWGLSAQYSPARASMAWPVMAGYGLSWCGMCQHSMAWHNPVWHEPGYHGPAQHGSVWHGTAACPSAQLHAAWHPQTPCFPGPVLAQLPLPASRIQLKLPLSDAEESIFLSLDSCILPLQPSRLSLMTHLHFNPCYYEISLVLCLENVHYKENCKANRTGVGLPVPAWAVHTAISTRQACPAWYAEGTCEAPYWPNQKKVKSVHIY